MPAATSMPTRQVPRRRGVCGLVWLLVAGLLCLAAGPLEASPQRQRRSRRRAQTRPTTERVKEIQSALAQAGYYSGEPSGKWDSRTVEAMKRLQEANDLKPTGKITARSLQLLGLGSEVAGLSPPREPAVTASAPD